MVRASEKFLQEITLLAKDGYGTVNASSARIINAATPIDGYDLATKNYVDDQVASSSGAVDSVFGRTGIVIASSGDYNSNQITNLSNTSGLSVSNSLDYLDGYIASISDNLNLHASQHQSTGSDPLLVELLGTSDTNTSNVLKPDGVGGVIWGIVSGGSGSISGPEISIDNSLVRWDGVDGYTIQDSSIIIDDSDNITGVLTLNGVTIENHSSRHENGGSDAIEISSLETSELDTALVLRPDGTGGVSWVTASGAVDSVFGRTGTVTAETGDYNTDQVSNASSVIGITVTEALEYLDGYISSISSNISQYTILPLLSGVDTNDSSGWKVIGMSEINSNDFSGQAIFEVVLFTSDGYSDGYARLYNATNQTIIQTLETTSNEPSLLTNSITLDSGSNIYELQIKIEQDDINEFVSCSMGRIRINSSNSISNFIIPITSGVVTNDGYTWNDIGIVEINTSEYNYSSSILEFILSSTDENLDGYLSAEVRLYNLTEQKQVGIISSSESNLAELVSQNITLDTGSNLYVAQLRLSENGDGTDFAVCSMARIVLE
jgi:hypothetical protein